MHESDGRWLWDVASGLAGVAVPWSATSAEPPATRVYERLLVAEQYDVWLIHWPPGASLGLHDHGGSAGAFCVVSGELRERAHHADGATTDRVVVDGEGAVFGPTRLHAISNPNATTATSVHVYSPPLEQMAFYDPGSAPSPPVRVEREADWTRDSVSDRGR